jgi:hypothetical protein
MNSQHEQVQNVKVTQEALISLMSVTTNWETITGYTLITHVFLSRACTVNLLIFIATFTSNLCVNTPSRVEYFINANLRYQR